MGLEPFLVSSSITGVIAQRLVRVICPDCKKEYKPPDSVLEDVGMVSYKESVKFYRGKGCNKCMQTGYRGRIGIFELMVPSDDIRALAVSKASTTEIRKAALKAGMRTMQADGLEKVRSGRTTLEEVMRVTQQEE
jgi:type II secretory ATPase GspE/PulE/Tfp pilus assembly ATPase PilB-like protein